MPSRHPAAMCHDSDMTAPSTRGRPLLAFAQKAAGLACLSHPGLVHRPKAFSRAERRGNADPLITPLAPAQRRRWGSARSSDETRKRQRASWRSFQSVRRIPIVCAGGATSTARLTIWRVAMARSGRHILASSSATTGWSGPAGDGRLDYPSRPSPQTRRRAEVGLPVVPVRAPRLGRTINAATDVSRVLHGGTVRGAGVVHIDQLSSRVSDSYCGCRDDQCPCNCC